MIISHKKKFIFVKTQKVSGTSMEIALSHSLGRKDVITPLNLEDEVIRYKKTKKFPQNYSKDLKFEQEYKNYIRMLSKKRVSKEQFNKLEKIIEDKKINNNIFFNHMKAKDIRKKVGKKIWNKYFKFSIDRNPYDKIISFMYFANRFKKIKNIQKEIQKTINLKKYMNYPIYTEKKKVILDYIINYENLRNNIKNVENKIRIPILKHYVHTKNYTRKTKKKLKYFFNKRQSDKIFMDCYEEFKIMKFKKLYE